VKFVLKEYDWHFYSENFHVDMIRFTVFTPSIIRLPNYIRSLDYWYFYNSCDITFLTMFVLTHPVNFPCGRKPEHPEKTIEKY
jgi:hypothetical protein